jgi:sugar lactone lactonase YvrE
MRSPIPFLFALLAFAAVPVAADTDPRYTFTHFTGAEGGNGSEDGDGQAARFFSPVGIGIDSAGNLYVADLNNSTVRKISPDGATRTLAGLAGAFGFINGTGVAAIFNGPAGTGVDAAGNVYVADILNHAIRKITPAGVVTTFAGGGSNGSGNGQGTSAHFSYPADIAVDSAGNVYVADGGNHSIRKITPSGLVTTLAGSVSQGFQDGTATVARFRSPQGVAVDGSGNVYVADTANDAIRKIAPDGQVTTLAGHGGPGRADGTGAAASFYRPSGVVVGPSGNLYIADTDNNLIRKVTPAGVVTTLAGGSEFANGGSKDGTGTNARFTLPYDITADAAGNLYVAEGKNHTVRKITGESVVTTFAGKAAEHVQTNGGPAEARFLEIRDMTMDAGGNIFLIDSHTIRKITTDGTVTTLAGAEPTGLGVYLDGSTAVARFEDPRGLTVDAAGNLYIVEQTSHTIRKMVPGGAVTTMAGARNQRGRTDGAAKDARFASPNDIAADRDGSLYVTEDCTIRRIAPDGNVTTLLGKPIPPAIGCFENKDGPFASARINGPSNIVIDSAGDLYVTTIQIFGDTFVATTANTIRKVSRSGLVTTIAGDDAKRESYRDATGGFARFYNIGGMAMDGAGILFVTEPKVHTIRRVSPAGLVATIGGFPGEQGSGDGTALDARFQFPQAIVIDSAGRLFVGEGSGRVRVGRPALPDEATIDVNAGVAGGTRQLDAAPQNASTWQWRMIRRPAASVSTLSSPVIRNPSFLTDLADLYQFRLTASDFNNTSITTAFVLGADGAATSTGSAVTIKKGDASLIFPTVTAAGRTLIADLTAAFDEPLPTPDVIPILSYDLTTTATFTPPARFCVAFPTLTTNTASRLAHYKIFHREGVAYVDRTTSRDVATKTICADITTLGRVVVGGPGGRGRAVTR